MNKRKIILLATALCMVAILAVGGTLAYFTDTDEKTNVFTIGRVDITLEEDFGNVVEGSDETDKQLMPGKENAIKKEVWIELESGSRDSYVWYEYWIPAYLDSTDGSTGLNNILHVNAFGYTWDEYFESYTGPNGEKLDNISLTWDHDPNVELPTLLGPQGYIGSEVVDGIEYNKYAVLYHGILSNTINAGDNDADGNDIVKTAPAMSQVYLDAMVDYDVDENVYTYYGEPIVISGEGEDAVYLRDVADVKIYVYAFAIQADTFANVYDAYTAYYAQMNAIGQE